MPVNWFKELLTDDLLCNMADPKKSVYLFEPELLLGIVWKGRIDR